MSNLEKNPNELLIGDDDDVHGREPLAVAILAPREVPLGGPRAMTVRRTLPSRERSMIGAWCFVDHYGPTDVQTGTGMLVPPHPHTGLQTVSWLFDGEIEHRDSVGSHALVRPGELNLMTAGRGISHSEVSTDATTLLRGVQLWLALPEAAREVEPFFESHAAVVTTLGGASVQVFFGTVAGVTASATTFTRVVAAQIDLPRNTRIELAVDPRDEHGVLVDTGSVTIDGTPVARTELAFVEAGASGIAIATGDDDARLILIGGEPFGEQIVMWWNFVGRTHEEIVAFRAAWQAEAIGDGDLDARDARFTSTHGDPGTRDAHGYSGAPLPAPALPTVRLLPRRR
ncbi:pirin family protein [Agreia sp.]|uniref:pirin family protein n=1 Tax=Agreia sp. TaxID=1872416 RepID=UPI0035BBA6F1